MQQFNTSHVNNQILQNIYTALHIILQPCIAIHLEETYLGNIKINEIFMVLLVADGTDTATDHDCKYIEVSAMLDHKVDELLVGIVRQIRLNRECGGRLRQRRKDQRTLVKSQPKDPPGCLHISPFSLLRRLFRKQESLSKSCEDLMVL